MVYRQVLPRRRRGDFTSRMLLTEAYNWHVTIRWFKPSQCRRDSMARSSTALCYSPCSCWLQLWPARQLQWCLFMRDAQIFGSVEPCACDVSQLCAVPTLLLHGVLVVGAVWQCMWQGHTLVVRGSVAMCPAASSCPWASIWQHHRPVLLQSDKLSCTTCS